MGNNDNFLTFVAKVAAVSFVSGLASAAGYHIANSIASSSKKEEPKVEQPKQEGQPKQEEPATVEAK